MFFQKLSQYASMMSIVLQMRIAGTSRLVRARKITSNTGITTTIDV